MKSSLIMVLVIASGGMAAIASDVRWTGVGSDALMTTAANWSGAVDLENGTSRAVFADGGVEALVVGSTFLNGLSFNASQFAVSAADGNARLRLASGGITTAGSGSYAVNMSVGIEGDQVWDVGQDVSISGALDSDPLARYTITKRGSGVVTISGSHGTFAGSLIQEDGGFILSGDDAVGSADGQISVGDGTMLTLDHATVSKPILIDRNNRWGDSTGLFVYGNREPSEFKGKVTCTMGNTYVFMNSVGASRGRMTFSGGIQCDGYLFFRLYGGSGSTGFSTVVITNKPFVSSLPFYPIAGNPNASGLVFELYLSAAGNEFSAFGWPNDYRLRNCNVYTTVDGALDSSDMPVYLGDHFTWDLCGTEQSVGFINVAHEEGPLPTITNTSEIPATLHMTQTENSTPQITFSGKLSVEYSGNFVTTIDHAMMAEGELSVSSGTVAFTGDGSWSKSTSVTVTGSGRVTVSHSRTFGKKSVLTVDSADSLQMAAGTEQWVSKLVLGGVEYTSGDFKFGAGTVHVGMPGMTIVLH